MKKKKLLALVDEQQRIITYLHGQVAECRGRAIRAEGELREALETITKCEDDMAALAEKVQI
jgi:hypothetical protein